LGFGRRKIDGEWKYVDSKGNLLSYDYMRGFHDRPFCIVVKDGKCGVVNADFDIVVPIEYTEIKRAYRYDNVGLTDWILYGSKNEQWYSIDLHKGIIISFSLDETERPSRNDKLKYIYYYNDFDILLYSNAGDRGNVQNIEYFGKQKEISIEMLLPAFNGHIFSLLIDDEVLSAKAILVKGAYEDEINFLFDNVDTYNAIAYSGAYEPYKKEIDLSPYVNVDHAHFGKYYTIYSCLNRQNNICVVYAEEDKFQNTFIKYIQLE